MAARLGGIKQKKSSWGSVMNKTFLLFYSPKPRSHVFQFQYIENGLLVYWLCITTVVIQLFRKRLSEKVHATIPKGIVGGFEFTVLQRNLKELARKAMKMCLRVLTESNKSRFDSYSRQEQCIDHIPYYLSGLSRAHFFRQPFSK